MGGTAEVIIIAFVPVTGTKAFFDLISQGINPARHSQSVKSSTT